MNQKQLWYDWRNLAHEDQRKLWAKMMSGKIEEKPVICESSDSMDNTITDTHVIPEEFFDPGGKNLADTIDADILEGYGEAAAYGVSYKKNGVLVKPFKDRGIDFIEVIERRDRITDALIVLLAEARALRMFNAESKIREAGRALENELYRQGELCD